MKLNRFIKNSDYTAEKQKQSFTITLSNTSISVGSGAQATRYVDYTVPSGVYFENVTWLSTYQTDQIHYVGNFLEYEPSDMMTTVTYTVAQINNTTYRLTATIMNWDSSTKNVTVGASAKVHLSVSPF